MIISLIKNELKNIFINSSDIIKYKDKLSLYLNIFIQILVNIVISIIFSLISFFIFNKYKEYSINESNLTKIFYILIIAILSIFYIIITINTLSKIIYKNNEKKLFLPLPISLKNRYISKLLAVYIKLISDYSLIFFSISLALIFTLFTSLNNSLIYLSIFFSFLISLFLPIFIIGISFIFVRINVKVNEIIKSKNILTSIITLFLIILIGLIYYFLLTILIKLMGDDSLNILFSGQNIIFLGKLVNYLYPFNFIYEAISFSSFSILNLFIFIFIFIISFLLIILFSYFNNYCYKKDNIYLDLNNNKKKYKFYSFPLLIKEFISSLRNGEHYYSYISLIIIIPLFSILFILFINNIFNIYSSFFIKDPSYLYSLDLPYFIALLIYNFPSYKLLIIVAFISFFISMMFSFNLSLFKNEESSFLIYLSFPLNINYIVISKLIFLLSSLFISLIILSLGLTIFNVLSFIESIILLIFTFIFTLSSIFYSFSYNLKDLKKDESLSNSLLSLIFLIIYILSSILLIIIFTSLDQNITYENLEIYTFLITLILFILLFIYTIYLFKKNLKRFEIKIKSNGVRILK